MMSQKNATCYLRRLIDVAFCFALLTLFFAVDARADVPLSAQAEPEVHITTDTTVSSAKPAVSSGLSSQPTFSQGAASGSSTVNQSGPAVLVGFNVIQSILALLSVFGIMFLIVWVLKKGKMIHTMPKGLLKQVAILPLSNKESVRVIECSDTWIVIGVTAQQITLLHTLSKEELPQLSDDQSHDIPFKDWFDSTLSRLRKSK